MSRCQERCRADLFGRWSWLRSPRCKHRRDHETPHQSRGYLSVSWVAWQSAEDRLKGLEG